MAAPWFKIYSKEILSDPKVKMLDHVQLGMLVLLWAFANEDGCCIPSDPDAIGKLLGIANRNQMVKHLVWIKRFFSPVEGDESRLVSLRLLAEQHVYEAKCEQLRLNGLKGGRPRKPEAKPDGYPDGKPDAEPSGEANKTEDGRRKKEKDTTPTPSRGRKPEKVQNLGVYPQEVLDGVREYKSLRKELIQPAILELFPEEKRFLAASVGPTEAVAEAWSKRTKSLVQGAQVSDRDVLEALRLVIKRKRREAEAGKQLSVPMLPTLLNHPLFVDALVKVKEVAHAS